MKKELSADSRIWIYRSDRTFSVDELNFIENRLNLFCKEWTAHNQALLADYEIRENKFIILAVDETQTDASGCSIDKSVRELKVIEDALKVNLLDKSHLTYWSGNEFKEIHFMEIQSAYDSGSFNDETFFYNLNIEKLSDLESKFKLPLKSHWAIKNLVK
ncbi:MAG TPA: ABC transporter ATPase [Bacteroidia bacterium]